MSVCCMDDFYRKKQNRTALIIFLLMVIVLVFIDQYTKYLVVNNLKGKNPISLINNILEFTYVENRGAAFGIFKDSRIFFIIISVVFCFILLFYYAYLPMIKKFRMIRVLIIFTVSGALGNMIDRIGNNYVIDFIYFKPIDFPVFNIADIYVTCSIIIFAILMIFYYKEEDLNAFAIRKKKSGKQ